MKTVLKAVHAGARRLASHPLFTDWLADASVDPRVRLRAFMPQAIDFVMGFRDLNRYFVPYPAPKDARERALNVHAEEDGTHSALFLTDWKVLGADAWLGWRPAELYWWMTAGATFGARQRDYVLARLVLQNADARMRFVIIEAIEAAGNVFFTRTVPLAERVEAEDGVELPYFGRHHLDREDGHLQHADERAFLDVVFTDAEVDRALGLVDTVYGIFHAHFDEWAALGRAVTTGSFAPDLVAEARADLAQRAELPHDPYRFLRLEWPPAPEGAHVALVAELHAALRALSEAPAWRWLAATEAGAWREAGRAVMLHWVVDAWACADFFAIDARFPAPGTALERGINRLTVLLEAQMKRRYVEWELVGADAHTGWSAGQALAHYWLDPGIEKQREAFAGLRALTIRHPDAWSRYWILKLFARLGDAMTEAFGAALRTSGVPDRDFPAFAGVPELLHPDLPPDEEADAALAAVETTPLSPEQTDAVRALLRELAAQEWLRADATWESLRAGRYASARPPALPTEATPAAK